MDQQVSFPEASSTIPSRASSDSVLVRALTIVLTLVFALAAITKLRDLTGLYQVLEISLPLPTVALWPVAQGIIAAEILVAIALSLRLFRRVGLVGSAILSLSFLGFSVFRLVKDLKTPCHCFGDLIHLTPLQSCFLCSAMLTSSIYLLTRIRPEPKNPTIDRSNAWFIFGIGALSLCFALSGYVKRQPLPKPLVRLNISSEAVLAGASDFVGTSPKNTVIMFGDYQCPPCRAVSGQISALIRDEPGRMKLAFRNLPFDSIHPYARKAAALAEQARSTGEFWSVHDALYAQEMLDDKKIDVTRRRFRLPQPSPASIEKVANDANLADQLGLNATPSFVLIDQDGNCWRTDNFASLLQYLK